MQAVCQRLSLPLPTPVWARGSLVGGRAGGSGGYGSMTGWAGSAGDTEPVDVSGR